MTSVSYCFLTIELDVNLPVFVVTYLFLRSFNAKAITSFLQISQLHTPRRLMISSAHSLQDIGSGWPGYRLLAVKQRLFLISCQCSLQLQRFLPSKCFNTCSVFCFSLPWTSIPFSDQFADKISAIICYVWFGAYSVNGYTVSRGSLRSERKTLDVSSFAIRLAISSTSG